MLLRIIINAVVLFIVIGKLPGIFVDTLGGALLGVLIVGLANGIIRPLLIYAEIPFNFLTLGSLTLLTNLLALFMVVKTLPGFEVSSLMAPAAGILLMTVCSFTLSRMIQDR
ncbi:phage holin family protein [Lucifera butyrica]|nr:phage holin family protein [Lucifera butyrica]